jgi:alkylation response protein AidB-like acyl-CoA dehydrogenase
MDFTLPQEAQTLAQNVAQWASRRMRPAMNWTPLFHAGGPYSAEPYWSEFVELGLLGAEASGGSIVDEVVGLMEAARFGMPGPILEADLALATKSPEAAAALEAKQLFTSVWPTGGADVVSWGAQADLVVSQADGRVLARSPLPPVEMSHALPHGWLQVPRNESTDLLAARRWVIGSALVVALVGGALDMSAAYARQRRQFGRPLGHNQAIQLRLAEVHIGAWSARHSVLDCAWRFASHRDEAPVASALCWLWTESMARRAIKHCHQVFGALGFCEEAGLVRLTWQIDWLCMSIGRTGAEDRVLAARSVDSSAPFTRILDGYTMPRALNSNG